MSCVWAQLISDTVLPPAVCAWWAPPASHSRYLQIPADKTIICSASPWFRASGSVWCLSLVNWLEKDGRFEISPAPSVYFLPYHPDCMHGQAFFELLTLALQFAAAGGLSVFRSAKLCSNAHVAVACYPGAKSHFSVCQKEHVEKCSNLIPTPLNQSRGNRKYHFGMRSLFW